MSRKTLKWLLPAVLAGLFMAVPAVFARGKGWNPTPPASKKVKNRQHRRELKHQRQRIKQSRKSVQAESQMDTHAKPPKAQKHPMRKVQKHQSPNLRRANKNSHHH